MSWDSLVFLLGYYWPYLSVVLGIGLVVGWRSFTPPQP
tara:strand:+ start:933 stop:1046 length:114 start_codon:yes stop_codon:yes gene_type:complete